MEFAQGTKVITDAAAQKYLDELNKLTGTLEVMWAKQAAASKVWTFLISFHLCSLTLVQQEPWNQQKFEELLMKFIVATDQPFTLTKEQSFRDLLQCTHHYATASLKIPGPTTVKSRVMELGAEVIEGLKSEIAVCAWRLYSLTTHSLF
jgi:hypothetical protein